LQGYDGARQEQLWKTNDRKAQKAGEHATVYAANGDKYRGQYLNNMRHGQGTLTYKNGSKYEGEFERDKQHGHGTHWSNIKGKLRMQYRGGFANGLRDGQGTYAYADGGRYDGEWKAGKRHGEGRMTYTDGSIYEGSWRNGMRHGPGTMFAVNGDCFQGQYAMDMKEGPGTFYYVSKDKRYDGVWSKDVAKCGLYGEMSEGGDSSLPQLTLLEPIKVLEERAFELEDERAIEGRDKHVDMLEDGGGEMTEHNEYLEEFPEEEAYEAYDDEEY
jgi:hypothetical protein